MVKDREETSCRVDLEIRPTLKIQDSGEFLTHQLEQPRLLITGKERPSLAIYKGALSLASGT